MITIVAVLASLYFIVGLIATIQTYITNKRVYKQLKHNQYHQDRASELYGMFVETGDISYLEYATEELKKIRY